MKKPNTKLILIIIYLYSLFCIICSISAPVLAHFEQYDLSGKLYEIFIFSCHHQPTRSFWIFGYPMTICARCFGIYTGLFLISLIEILKKFTPKIFNKNKKVFFIAIFLFVLFDLAINIIFNIDTGNIIRFLAGIFMSVLFISFIKYLFYKKEKL